VRLVNADADYAIPIGGSLWQSVCFIWISEREPLGPAHSGVVEPLKRSHAKQLAECDAAVQNVEVPTERCSTSETGWDGEDTAAKGEHSEGQQWKEPSHDCKE